MKWNVAMRRPLLIILAVVLTCTTLSGVPVDAASSRHSTMQYSQDPLTFRYPTGWRVDHYTEVSSFTSSLVYLSNQKMHAPCTTANDSGGIQTRCGWPLAKLGSKGVLVEWTVGGGPVPQGFSIKGFPGELQTIDGHLAKIQVSRPGLCSSIGGQETVGATVADGSIPNNYYTFTACIRGPNLASAKSEVMASLLSTKFSKDG
jgi:hypothetical protein